VEVEGKALHEELRPGNAVAMAEIVTVESGAVFEVVTDLDGALALANSKRPAVGPACAPDYGAAVGLVKKMGRGYAEAPAKALWIEVRIGLGRNCRFVLPRIQLMPIR
jgi:hypothetical protein